MRWGFSHPRVATSQPRSPPREARSHAYLSRRRKGAGTPRWQQPDALMPANWSQHPSGSNAGGAPTRRLLARRGQRCNDSSSAQTRAGRAPTTGTHSMCPQRRGAGWGQQLTCRGGQRATRRSAAASCAAPRSGAPKQGVPHVPRNPPVAFRGASTET